MPEKEVKPLEAIRADELTAVRVDGVVVGIPERTEAIYIEKVPGLFGPKFPELVIKPLVPLPPEKVFELEKIEREKVPEIKTVEVPKVVEVPKTVEVPKIVEKPVEVKKLVKEEELTPEELKRLKPEEFEEEEIPPERREEFREQLGKVIEAIREKAIPKVKEGVKKLAEIGKTTVERIRGWLKKIGISPPEIEEAIDELIKEEKAKEKLSEVIP
jgi:hypothetical protein